MSFTAQWQLYPATSDPYESWFKLRVEGTARSYQIDWGDGTRDKAKPTIDSDGDGLKEGETWARPPYEDGTYDVSISQGGRGPYVDRWQVIVAREATDPLTISSGNRHDIIQAGSGDDVIRAGGGNDLVLGGAGDDRLVGGRGDGADLLYGGNGADTLIGWAGDDRLQGDNGADRLIGGAGADAFVFTRAIREDGGVLDIDPDRDTVLDFQQGADILDFENWRYRTNSIEFIGHDEFDGEFGQGQLRFEFTEDGNTVLFGDFQGTGTISFTVRLIGHFDLTAADFVF
jgi:Ca2+-binding RTX toxin-like protein